MLSRRDLIGSGAAALAAAIHPGIAAADPTRTGGARTHAKARDALAILDPALRPSARTLLADAARTPPLGRDTLASWRARGAARVAPLLPDVTVSQHTAPGLPGQPPVTLYVVNGGGAPARPAIFHTHGGGHVLGAARYELAYLQALARDLDCAVVTVDYRLAPECRYDGSTADTFAGLRWTHRHAAALGIDPDRIALLGESAGGTHAALLAIRARDEGVPVLFQALIYPMLDDRTGSIRTPPSPIGEILWDARANAFGWGAFLGRAPGGAGVPAAAVPARVQRLGGLPPTFIAVGGADLFVDEDVAYAARLIDAGVATELLVVPGAYHAFDRIAPDTAVARRFDAAKKDALRRAFAGT